MIRIEQLSKTFDGYTALNHLDLRVKKGSIYGLVGVNGSGKTTIIRHLSGYYRQDSGSVLIDDQPVYDNTLIKQRTAYIPDEMSFFSAYTLNGLRKLYSGLYKNWNDVRFNEYLERFKLDPRKLIYQFSKGMKKQAAFSLAVSCMPDVLLMDEPIDGMDPIVRKVLFHQLIQDAAERETTVLISSHNLKELEGVCDSIGIVKSGRMIMERDLDDIKAGMVKLQLAYSAENSAGPERYKQAGLNVLHYQKSENSSVELLIVRGNSEEAEVKVRRFNPLICDILPLTLDEIFIYETEGAIDENLGQ